MGGGSRGDVFIWEAHGGEMEGEGETWSDYHYYTAILSAAPTLTCCIYFPT